MKNTLSSEDRRLVRKSLSASLAVVLTLVFGIIAWPDATLPAAETPVPSLSTATPAAPAAAEETSNETVGCGCAESCLVAN